MNPECALAGPHPRALFYRVYRTGMTFRYNRNFCKQCRRDIEQAKKHWRTGEVFPPSRRLPPPDLTKWIEELKDEDFQEGGQAFILLNHDKSVMPALMKRMYTLPSEGPESPRATADWIARAIVMQEAMKRAGQGFKTDWAMGDRSSETQWWWMKEGRRFMTGSDWELPETVSLIPEDAPEATEGTAGEEPAADPSFVGPVQQKRWPRPAQRWTCSGSWIRSQNREIPLQTRCGGIGSPGTRSLPQRLRRQSEGGGQGRGGIHR